MDLLLSVINWNIGAAKHLKKDEDYRKKYTEGLSNALARAIEQHQPHVITLQETVRHSANGDENSAQEVIKFPKEYHYFPHMLIDSHRHANRGKWRKLLEVSREHSNDSAKSRPYLGQGNGILIRKDVPLFPLWSLPKIDVTQAQIVKNTLDAGPAAHDANEARKRHLIEVVQLETGLYFGNRDTEPRCAQVAHIVLSDNLKQDNKQKLTKPLDIFIVNLHLTTIAGEREGIPSVDEQAVEMRKKQLDIVFNGIVSRYNTWRRDKYKLGGEKLYDDEIETDIRHEPIWIIAGDFNFTPESYEYELIRRRNFGDLLKKNSQHTKSSGVGHPPTLTVDYVFAGPLFVSIDPYIARTADALQHNKVLYDRVTQDVSDHFPIFSAVPISLPDGN